MYQSNKESPFWRGARPDTVDITQSREWLHLWATEDKTS